MPVIRNQSPYGALDVPLLGCTVDAGAEPEVTEDQARRLLPQVDNWAPVDDAAKAIADEHAVLLEAENSDGPPVKNATKAAWVGYAQAQGDTEADTKTKDQLIAEYGETS